MALRLAGSLGMRALGCRLARLHTFAVSHSQRAAQPCALGSSSTLRLPRLSSITRESTRRCSSLPELFTTHTGLMYRDVHLPEAGVAVAERSQHVTVHYTGRLDDGTVFDSSYERGKPIQFQLGRGEVIRGWDEGNLPHLCEPRLTVTS